MEKDEALQDAIKQFQTQGVDLTNIDTTGADRDAQRRATAEALELLKRAVTSEGGLPDEALCRQALADLTAACTNEKANPSEEEEGLEGGPVRMEKNVRAPPLRRSLSLCATAKQPQPRRHAAAWCPNR